MNPDSKALGHWVQTQRERLDLTQDELATRVHCSKGYISKIEKAAYHSDALRPPAPTLQFLYNLARALGTSMAAPLTALGYLKKADGEMEASTSHPVRILHYYNELSKEDQAIAETLVKGLWLKQKRANDRKESLKPALKPRKKKTA